MEGQSHDNEVPKDKALRLIAHAIRAIPNEAARRRQAETTARIYHARAPHFNAPKFLAMCGFPSWTDGVTISVFGRQPHPYIHDPSPDPVSSPDSTGEEQGGGGAAGPAPPDGENTIL
jgi:hypothetical protein